MKTTITLLIFITFFSLKTEAANWPFGNKTFHHAKHVSRVEHRRVKQEIRKRERNAKRSALRTNNFLKKKSWIHFDKKTKKIIRHDRENKLFAIGINCYKNFRPGLKTLC